MYLHKCKLTNIKLLLRLILINNNFYIKIKSIENNQEKLNLLNSDNFFLI